MTNNSISLTEALGIFGILYLEELFPNQMPVLVQGSILSWAVWVCCSPNSYLSYKLRTQYLDSLISKPVYQFTGELRRSFLVPENCHFAANVMFTSKMGQFWSWSFLIFLKSTPKVGPLEVDPPPSPAVARAASSDVPVASTVSGSMSTAWHRTHLPATSKASRWWTWRMDRKWPSLGLKSYSQNILKIFHLISLDVLVKVMSDCLTCLTSLWMPAPPNRKAMPFLHRLGHQQSSPQTLGNCCTLFWYLAGSGLMIGHSKV